MNTSFDSKRSKDAQPDSSGNRVSLADTPGIVHTGHEERQSRAEPPHDGIGPDKASPRGVVTKQDVVRRIKYNYAFAHKDPSNRILDSLVKIIVDSLKPGRDLIQSLNDVAKMIDKHLQIRATTIGIRDPVDGRFRYVAMSGLKEEEWKEHRLLSYSTEEFFDPVKYRGAMISDLTKLFLAEDLPFNPDEKGTFNLKLSSAMIRRSSEDANEADYLDIYIKSPGNDILGWIEITGTTFGKIPEAGTIRWLEAIATVLGLVLTVRGFAPIKGNR